jgi:hypothetical protein
MHILRIPQNRQTRKRTEEVEFVRGIFVRSRPNRSAPSCLGANSKGGGCLIKKIPEPPVRFATRGTRRLR